jgi:hypothetical protein
VTDDAILLPGSALRDTVERVATSQRIVFVAGLSGVGKSLLVQQLARLAGAAGRVTHLLQWDVCRAAFETPAILDRYPEVEGATHMAIRKAVGLWVRDAVQAWHVQHPSAEHVLIGEPPLTGNRLIELAQRRDDEPEALLAGPESLFLVPVPSRAVRATIEAARARSIASPTHARESADAPPNVMADDWLEIHERAVRLGVAPPSTEAPAFDPDAYARVYQHWLRHRRTELLPIDVVLDPAGSVYDIGAVASELAANSAQVEHYMTIVERSGDLESMQEVT